MKTKPDEPPHPPQNKAISANTERGTAPDNTAPKGPKKGVGANRYAKLGPFRYRPVENKTGRPKGTGAIRKTGTAKSAARSSKAGETSGMSERISKTSTARATGRREEAGDEMPCWTWAVPKDAPTLKHGGDLEMVVKREHMLGWLANLGSRINERRSQDRKTTHLDPVKLKITFNSNDLKRKVWCEHYGEPSPVLLAEVLRDGRTLYVKAPRPGPKEEKDLEESAIQTGEIVRTKAYLSFVD